MKTRILITSLLFLGILSSLFFPYIHRINIVNYGEGLSAFSYGYEMMSTILSVTALMITTILMNFSDTLKRWQWSLASALVNLCAVWLIRFEIHFQGFIDHDFDTRSGVGYYMLFAFSIAFVLVCLIYISIYLRKRSIQD